MGNILTQKRNGGGTSATALDELTYNYHTTTDGLVSNRLYQVNDVVSAGNYTDDIDDQGTFNNTHSTIETANNYGYDELGNLVRDAQEEIASIEWTVYGKMKKITRNSGSSKADLEFGYDASGNRLWKKVTPKGSGAVISTYYYLRDAQGNEMCRYVKYTNTTSQLMYVAEEHSIYGSSRVGVDGRKDTLYKAGSYSPAWGGANTSRRALGLKSFELANHLGSVLVTVSDKPIYKVSSGTIYFQPEVTSISDYYPFGAPITGRGYSSEAYRFGFNKQEKTDEIAGPGNHNTATFWEYDGRLGRRWNIDPKPNPAISSFTCFANNPIWFSDILGDTVNIEGSRREKRQFTRMLNKTTGNKYGIDLQGNLFNTRNNSNILTDNKKSGELSALLRESILTHEVIKVSLSKNDKNVAFDRFDDARLDLGDFKKAPREFQAGILGHVFSERLNTPGGYSNLANRNDAGYDAGHQQGLLAESRIITSMLGSPFGLRYIAPSQPSISTWTTPSGQEDKYITSFEEIWSYGNIQYFMRLGVQRTEYNDGTNRSEVKSAVGDVLEIYKK